KKLRQSFQSAREAWAVTRRHPGNQPPQSVRAAFDLPIRDEALLVLARASFSRAVEDRLAAAATDVYRGGVVDNRDLMLENGARRRALLVGRAPAAPAAAGAPVGSGLRLGAGDGDRFLAPDARRVRTRGEPLVEFRGVRVGGARLLRHSVRGRVDHDEPRRRV